jgi:hypothetical protein
MTMTSRTWDTVAQVAFFIGCAPMVVGGFILSFFEPVGSLAEWFVWGMSWGAYVTLFLGVVAGFAVGGILASPFWITARVLGRRERMSMSDAVGLD